MCAGVYYRAPNAREQRLSDCTRLAAKPVVFFFFILDTEKATKLNKEDEALRRELAGLTT